MRLNLDLSSAHAKVARAREHLESFEREFAALPDERKPYAFTIGQINEDGWVSIFVTANPVLNHRFGTIASDAVHNLRCALDYIVTELVEKSPRAKLCKAHQFPIYDDRDRYTKEVGDEKTARPKGCLRGVVHGLKNVWAVQPFHGNADASGHPLFIVNRFSNADKHRIITQPRAVPGKVEVVVPEHDGRVIDMRPGDDEPVEGAKNKFETMRIRFARPFPTYIRYNPSVGVVLEIATPEFDGQPLKVIELYILERCSDYVAKTLEFFEKL